MRTASESTHTSKRTRTLVFVSKAPSPQKVPPPMELPPMRSNLSSDSTFGMGKSEELFSYALTSDRSRFPNANSCSVSSSLSLSLLELKTRVIIVALLFPNPK